MKIFAGRIESSDGSFCGHSLADQYEALQQDIRGVPATLAGETSLVGRRAGMVALDFYHRERNAFSSEQVT